MITENSISTGVLYHVTTASSVDGIWMDGVDPRFSTGKLDASWYVTKHQILWAVCHVLQRHDCKIDDVYVCAVLVDWKKMRKTNLAGRYYTLSVFHVESINPAVWFIDAEKFVLE